MAIIAHLSDKQLSYNSVEMTEKSCFLMVAHSGFGPGYLLWTGATLEPQKQLLTVHSVFSKPMYFHSYALYIEIRYWHL